ncbi:MAG: STAS domain-containing protein [Nitrospirae bacterium]|nr:STAS domain-containing protein [Nitrospirota bacterium]
MEITERKENNVIVVSVAGRLDAVTATGFEKHMSTLISGGEKKVVVDLGSLEYISSAGLRGILSTAKKLKAESGAMYFAGLRGPVAEVFKISGFYSIFKIADSVETAIKQI